MPTPVPVAIVGRGCVLPGALDPGTFWGRVVAGEDLVSEAPAGAWGMDHDLALTPDPSRSADKAWSDRGGYVRGFEQAWRPDGFRVPAASLAGLDPLFLWLLHAGRAALAEAGVDPTGRRAGAVVGNLSFPSVAMSRFAEAVWRGETPTTDPRNRFMSGLPAQLLAEALGLSEGALALDAACASSLYALRIAADRLADGELDLAVAGAVSRSDDLFIHVGFSALQALSKSGRSRPFHAEADGLLPCEGCVLFALERLDDARRLGHRVLGVIRAVGLSNDGRGGGILAPDAAGQVRSMRAAYAAAGLRPDQVGLVECHATGTPVGDKVELTSMGEVFAGCADVRIGSVKSNVGHPITAAGAVALLKVLGALEHGVLPPTLHAAEAPTSALAGTPFRLQTHAEPWPADRPRRAAVSAFGFGGNNAHLIVEADGVSEPAAGGPAPRAPIAVVGLGVRAGDLPDTAAFAAFVRGERGASPCAARVSLPLTGLRFPPRDLAQALPQQLLVLAAANEAVGAVASLPRERTGVFIGMGADPEVCRYGLRWRLAERARDEGWSDATLAEARDGVVPVLQAPGVVGTMPNIPANRLHAAFDLAGPGFTVSSEELSGLDALALARRALSAGELDAALVGAVDLSCEPVHAAALRALGRAEPTGDAAVVLLLERLDDARAHGHPVLAVLDDLDVAGEAPDVAPIGHAHAAAALVRVAAAVVAPRGPAGVHATAGGERRRVTLRAPTAAERGAGAPSSSPQGPALELPAHWSPVTLPAPAGKEPHVHTMPPAPWLPPVLGAPPATPAEAVVDGAALLGGGERPRIVRLPEEVGATLRPPPPPSSTGVTLGAGAAPAAPRVAPPPATTAPPPAGPVAPAPAGSRVEAALLAEQQRVAATHARFLKAQSDAHAQFLAARERAAALLLQRAAGGPGAASARPVVAAAMPAPAPAPVATPPAPTVTRAPAPSAPSAPPAVAPKPAPAPVAAKAPAPKPAPPKPPPAPVAATPAPAGPTPPPPAASLPGLKLDRAQLEVHASGRISEIFGPLFAKQDGYHRQVRMPEPPLLLADRMVGLDCAPGVLGRGTIWTETDVGSQGWYLHQGRMPAGVMIEAGQADLMLISYMGIDFLNRSERVYRLLGCELTYRGGLPRVGDTLRYEIHVDGHANQGPVRLFFFHYDCKDQHGRPRLEVRGGQAGFFTEAELDDSAGVLWDAETGEHDAGARVDPPKVPCTRTRFEREHIEAFAAGDAAACFGPGFELARTHDDTPRIQPPPMLFFHTVDVVDPKGGPWGKGYLRATWKVSPDDWFFEGHFKNDPCMPGTLMFEGCLQALAFYLASLGYTLERDGWRFEPVPDHPIPMRCRGQVLPDAVELTYEVFVEEVHAGPIPTVYADLLCTVDGLKAFHARRCGLQLVPAWPLDHLAPALLEGVDESGRTIAEADGFRFDARSILACAWGRPSEAFGPMYRRFDGPLKVPRLPGPPYLFMSRVEQVDGPIGGMKVGTRIRAAWDVPADAWFFDANGAQTMPFAVFLEAALQPCGWLASYVGSALTVDEELFFRNLDGTGTLRREILRSTGTLITDVTITGISRSGGMIIQSFDVACSVDGEVVYDMKTVFGFFPAKALANQKGLSVTAEDRAALDRPPAFTVDLTTRPARFFGGSLRLPPSGLCMIDRVHLWPDGGKEGLGRLVSEKDVETSEWFFKAHFFQDPVQPGSLGLEAMFQVLQAWMIEQGMGEGMAHPRFEPIALDEGMTWKYRGQVVPRNRLIRVEVDITGHGRDARGVWAKADARLWVDELCIYSGENVAMRIVDGPPPGHVEGVPVPDMDAISGCAPYVRTQAPPAPAAASLGRDVEVVDPAVDTWVGDHRPTWTVPALPMMDLVDRLARAAARAHPGQRVLGLDGVSVRRWVAVTGPITLRTEVDGDRVRLLEGDEVVCEGRVRLGACWDEAPEAWPALDGAPAADPYATGRLFHGPAFQLLTALTMGATGSSARLDAGRSGAPAGLLRPGLLDAATHGIPHDGLHAWSPRIQPELAAYPLRLERLRLYGDLPTSGEVRVEARFDGFAGSQRMPAILVQLVGPRGVLAELRLVEILVPKGPLGDAPPAERAAFLRDHLPVGLALSTFEGDVTVLARETVQGSDWLPGTVASVYGVTEGDLLPAVACRDHVARRLGVHPRDVRVAGDVARVDRFPLNPTPLAVEVKGAIARVRGEPDLDLTAVEAWWLEWFGVGRWPVEDLYYSLIERFVRRVDVRDPAGLGALNGRAKIFLANHQTAIESLLFSIVVGGLTGVPVVTIAKDEHRDTWLGRLIAHCFSWPGVRDPEVITFFERSNKEGLAAIVGRLAPALLAHEKSLLVHVEGTRAHCARHRVEKLSGAFLDLAVQAGLPVVPVAFVGGLPVAPVADKLSYPVGEGQQDIVLGSPISADALRALPLRERKDHVLAALQALSPSDEAPLPPQPALTAAADAWVARTGVDRDHAVILETLRASSRRSPWTQRLVRAVADGELAVGDGPQEAWLAELARRLFGDGGPTITRG